MIVNHSRYNCILGPTWSHHEPLIRAPLTLLSLALIIINVLHDKKIEFLSRLEGQIIWGCKKRFSFLH